TTPTSVLLSTTGSAPTFFSSINWMASKTMAFGPIDQTVEAFLCAKIELTFPLISIFIFSFLQAYVHFSDPNHRSVRAATPGNSFPSRSSRDALSLLLRVEAQS